MSRSGSLNVHIATIEVSDPGALRPSVFYALTNPAVATAATNPLDFCL